MTAMTDHVPDQMSRGMRLARTVPHWAGLAMVIAAAFGVGRPVGWVGVGALLGPAAVVGVRRLLRGSVAADDLEALAFGGVIALMTAGGWALAQAPSVHQAFVIGYPVALLAFLFGACNFVLVATNRSLRAWRGDELDYPWLTDAVRGRIVAIRQQESGSSHGHR